MLVVPEFYPVPYQIAQNVAEADTQGKRHGKHDAPENYQEAHCDDCIAQSYILKDNTEGDDDKENPDAFSDEISVFDPCVFAGQIDNPAQEVTEYDPDNQNNQRYDYIRQGSGNTGRILGELGYTHVVQAK